MRTVAVVYGSRELAPLRNQPQQERLHLLAGHRENARCERRCFNPNVAAHSVHLLCHDLRCRRALDGNSLCNRWH